MPVYGLLYDFAVDVEKQTRRFAGDFRWLRVQALRSSESSFANLSEGFYSQYSTEYLQALYRTKREARETVSHLKYSVDVEQKTASSGNALLTRYEEALRQLGNLIKSIEKKIRERGKSIPGFSKVREEHADYHPEPDADGHSEDTSASPSAVIDH